MNLRRAGSSHPSHLILARDMHTVVSFVQFSQFELHVIAFDVVCVIWSLLEEAVIEMQPA